MRPALLRLALLLIAASTLGCTPAIARAEDQGAAAPPSAPEDPWQAAMDRVVPAVVSIRLTTPRDYDTQRAGSGGATGFVVDAARGLILTNRHVVGPGPVVAEAVFSDHSVAPLHVVYRDPVHDFGLFRYDPEALPGPRTAELALAPGIARVGDELRVLGNDAGEKLSILSGVLARLDRDAPTYGRGRYNDWNTFYLQAASGTSGGSSGSPVIDREGRVIALNAGARKGAASSFYLPLDRVVRALELVRAGQPVPRGTLGVELRRESFEDLARLGLSDAAATQARADHPSSPGLLVVRDVHRGGPGAGRLQPGDVLLAIDGAPLSTFVPLEERLDERVDQRVTLTVERGGAPREVEILVGDLHALTPTRYVEVAGGLVHALSLQKARAYNARPGRPVVASDRWMFDRAGVPKSALIRSVGEHKTPTLDAFWEAVQALPDGARVPVRWSALNHASRSSVAVVTMDRALFPLRLCAENPDGDWPCVDAPPPPPAPTQPARTADLPSVRHPVGRKLAASLVWVEADLPVILDGLPGDEYSGTGVLVDAARGLVLVDRDTVPNSLADVRVTVGGSVTVPARVAWVHPVHDFAFVRFDPTAIGDTPLRSARLHAPPIRPGQKLFVTGLTAEQHVSSTETVMTRLSPLDLRLPRVPRYRDRDIDVVRVREAGAEVGGVLADAQGRVRAHWVSEPQQAGGEERPVSVGIPIQHALRALQGGLDPSSTVAVAGVELLRITLADARDRGLPDEVLRALGRAGGDRPGVLQVRRRSAGFPVWAALREGDLLVSAFGQPVVFTEELELAIQRGPVPLLVYREGEPLEVTLESVPRSGRGTDRALQWAGLLLQAPPDDVALQASWHIEGLYISRWFAGSPADREGIRAVTELQSVNGVAVPDIDALLAVVAGLPDRAPVRLALRNRSGKTRVETLRLDLRFWPTWEVAWTDAGWTRIEHAP